MVTTTTTTAAITNTSVWCAAERDTEGVFTFRGLYRAYLACRRRKRASRDAQRYEVQLLDNLFDTLFRLRSNAYAPATSLCFVVRRPKAREIHAAAFADRVVHHWLVPRLSALYEPVFIHDLYSNREGKGTHAAVERLQRFMRALSSSGIGKAPPTSARHSAARVRQNAAAKRNAGHMPPDIAPILNPRAGFFLQLDIHNFFNSIDKPVLFQLLQGYIVRPRYRLVRRRVVGNLRAKLRDFEQRLWRGPSKSPRLHLLRAEREKLRAVLASYLGHFRHAHAYRLLQAVFRRFSWLRLLFAVRLRKGKFLLLPLWEPRAVSSYRGQIRWFRRLFPYAELWIQRGRETERFPPLIVGAPLGERDPRRQVRRIDVREAGCLKGGLKRRLITRFYLFEEYHHA